jgi:hypothetical protein
MPSGRHPKSFGSAYVGRPSQEQRIASLRINPKSEIFGRLSQAVALLRLSRSNSMLLRGSRRRGLDEIPDTKIPKDMRLSLAKQSGTGRASTRRAYSRKQESRL